MDQLWARMTLVCGLLASLLGAAFVPLAIRYQLDITDLGLSFTLSLVALPALAALASVTQLRQGGIANALLLWTLAALYGALIHVVGPNLRHYMWPALVFMTLTAAAAVGTLRLRQV